MKTNVDAKQLIGELVVIAVLAVPYLWLLITAPWVFW